MAGHASPSATHKPRLMLRSVLVAVRLSLWDVSSFLITVRLCVQEISHSSSSLSNCIGDISFFVVAVKFSAWEIYHRCCFIVLSMGLLKKKVVKLSSSLLSISLYRRYLILPRFCQILCVEDTSFFLVAVRFTVWELYLILPRRCQILCEKNISSFLGAVKFFSREIFHPSSLLPNSLPDIPHPFSLLSSSVLLYPFVGDMSTIAVAVKLCRIFHPFSLLSSSLRSKSPPSL